MYRNVCVLLLLLLPSLAAGQVSPALSPWNAVERLAAGERIEVQLMDYKTLKGSFDHATADVVYLGHGGKTIDATTCGACGAGSPDMEAGGRSSAGLLGRPPCAGAIASTLSLVQAKGLQARSLVLPRSARSSAPEWAMASDTANWR